MKYILNNQKGKEFLKGFFGDLLIEEKRVTIFELLLFVLNQVTEEERTSEEFLLIFDIQRDIFNAINSTDDVNLNTKDYKRIQKALVLAGLTPEAFGYVLKAIEIQ